MPTLSGLLEFSNTRGKRQPLINRLPTPTGADNTQAQKYREEIRERADEFLVSLMKRLTRHSEELGDLQVKDEISFETLYQYAIDLSVALYENFQERKPAELRIVENRKLPNNLDHLINPIRDIFTPGQEQSSNLNRLIQTAAIRSTFTPELMVAEPQPTPTSDALSDLVSKTKTDPRKTPPAAPRRSLAEQTVFAPGSALLRESKVASQQSFVEAYLASKGINLTEDEKSELRKKISQLSYEKIAFDEKKPIVGQAMPELGLFNKIIAGYFPKNTITKAEAPIVEKLFYTSVVEKQIADKLRILVEGDSITNPALKNIISDNRLHIARKIAAELTKNPARLTGKNLAESIEKEIRNIQNIAIKEQKDIEMQLGRYDIFGTESKELAKQIRVGQLFDTFYASIDSIKPPSKQLQIKTFIDENKESIIKHFLTKPSDLEGSFNSFISNVIDLKLTKVYGAIKAEVKAEVKTAVGSSSAKPKEPITWEEKLREKDKHRSRVMHEAYTTEQTLHSSMVDLVTQKRLAVIALTAAEKNKHSKKILVDFIKEPFVKLAENPSPILGSEATTISDLCTRITREALLNLSDATSYPSKILEQATAFAIDIAHNKDVTKTPLEMYYQQLRPGYQQTSALLIMPVQRIPRYELLFKELKKDTEEAKEIAVKAKAELTPDHKSHAELQKRIDAYEIDLKQIAQSLELITEIATITNKKTSLRSASEEFFIFITKQMEENKVPIPAVGGEKPGDKLLALYEKISTPQKETRGITAFKKYKKHMDYFFKNVFGTTDVKEIRDKMEKDVPKNPLDKKEEKKVEVKAAAAPAAAERKRRPAPPIPAGAPPAVAAAAVAPTAARRRPRALPPTPAPRPSAAAEPPLPALPTAAVAPAPGIPGDEKKAASIATTPEEVTELLKRLVSLKQDLRSKKIELTSHQRTGGGNPDDITSTLVWITDVFDQPALSFQAALNATEQLKLISDIKGQITYAEAASDTAAVVIQRLEALHVAAAPEPAAAGPVAQPAAGIEIKSVEAKTLQTPTPIVTNAEQKNDATAAVTDSVAAPPPSVAAVTPPHRGPTGHAPGKPTTASAATMPLNTTPTSGVIPDVAPTASVLSTQSSDDAKRSTTAPQTPPPTAANAEQKNDAAAVTASVATPPPSVAAVTPPHRGPTGHAPGKPTTASAATPTPPSATPTAGIILPSASVLPSDDAKRSTVVLPTAETKKAAPATSHSATVAPPAAASPTPPLAVTKRAERKTPVIPENTNFIVRLHTELTKLFKLTTADDKALLLDLLTKNTKRLEAIGKHADFNNDAPMVAQFIYPLLANQSERQQLLNASPEKQAEHKLYSTYLYVPTSAANGMLKSFNDHAFTTKLLIRDILSPCILKHSDLIMNLKKHNILRETPSRFLAALPPDNNEAIALIVKNGGGKITREQASLFVTDWREAAKLLPTSAHVGSISSSIQDFLLSHPEIEQQFDKRQDEQKGKDNKEDKPVREEHAKQLTGLEETIEQAQAVIEEARKLATEAKELGIGKEKTDLVTTPMNKLSEYIGSNMPNDQKLTITAGNPSDSIRGKTALIQTVNSSIQQQTRELSNTFQPLRELIAAAKIQKQLDESLDIIFGNTSDFKGDMVLRKQLLELLNSLSATDRKQALDTCKHYLTTDNPANPTTDAERIGKAMADLITENALKQAADKAVKLYHGEYKVLSTTENAAFIIAEENAEYKNGAKAKLLDAAKPLFPKDRMTLAKAIMAAHNQAEMRFSRALFNENTAQSAAGNFYQPLELALNTARHDRRTTAHMAFQRRAMEISDAMKNQLPEEEQNNLLFKQGANNEAVRKLAFSAGIAPLDHTQISKLTPVLGDTGPTGDYPTETTSEAKAAIGAFYTSLDQIYKSANTRTNAALQQKLIAVATLTAFPESKETLPDGARQRIIDEYNRGIIDLATGTVNDLPRQMTPKQKDLLSKENLPILKFGTPTPDIDLTGPAYTDAQWQIQAFYTGANNLLLNAAKQLQTLETDAKQAREREDKAATDGLDGAISRMIAHHTASLLSARITPPDDEFKKAHTQLLTATTGLTVEEKNALTQRLLAAPDRYTPDTGFAGETHVLAFYTSTLSATDELRRTALEQANRHLESATEQLKAFFIRRLTEAGITPDSAPFDLAIKNFHAQIENNNLIPADKHNLAVVVSSYTTDKHAPLSILDPTIKSSVTQLLTAFENTFSEQLKNEFLEQLKNAATNEIDYLIRNFDRSEISASLKEKLEAHRAHLIEAVRSADLSDDTMIKFMAANTSNQYLSMYNGLGVGTEIDAFFDGIEKILTPPADMALQMAIMEKEQMHEPTLAIAEAKNPAVAAQARAEFKKAGDALFAALSTLRPHQKRFLVQFIRNNSGTPFPADENAFREKIEDAGGVNLLDTEISNAYAALSRYHQAIQLTMHNANVAPLSTPIPTAGPLNPGAAAHRLEAKDRPERVPLSQDRIVKGINETQKFLIALRARFYTQGHFGDSYNELYSNVSATMNYLKRPISESCDILIIQKRFEYDDQLREKALYDYEVPEIENKLKAIAAEIANLQLVKQEIAELLFVSEQLEHEMRATRDNNALYHLPAVSDEKPVIIERKPGQSITDAINAAQPDRRPTPAAPARTAGTISSGPTDVSQYIKENWTRGIDNDHARLSTIYHTHANNLGNSEIKTASQIAFATYIDNGSVMSTLTKMPSMMSVENIFAMGASKMGYIEVMLNAKGTTLKDALSTIQSRDPTLTANEVTRILNGEVAPEKVLAILSNNTRADAKIINPAEYKAASNYYAKTYDPSGVGFLSTKIQQKMEAEFKSMSPEDRQGLYRLLADYLRDRGHAPGDPKAIKEFFDKGIYQRHNPEDSELIARIKGHLPSRLTSGSVAAMLASHYQNAMEQPEYQDTLRAAALAWISDYRLNNPNANRIILNQGMCTPELAIMVMAVVAYQNRFADDKHQIAVIDDAYFTDANDPKVKAKINKEAGLAGQPSALGELLKKADEDEKHPLHYLGKKHLEVFEHYKDKAYLGADEKKAAKESYFAEVKEHRQARVLPAASIFGTPPSEYRAHMRKITEDAKPAPGSAPSTPPGAAAPAVGDGKRSAPAPAPDPTAGSAPGARRRSV